ncbi:MAG: ribbon-helix-helix domain-containing protein [Pseudomonadota bacterium]
MSARSGVKKHSVTIRGHRTSLSLEPVFWQALKDDARAQGIALAKLIADLDDARIQRKDGLNLSSTIRVYLFEKHRDISFTNDHASFRNA